MKPRRNHIPALFLLLLTLAACELRPLYEEGVTPVEVVVRMDWTQLGGDPEGATIKFYPEDGGTPWTFQTNSVKRTTVQVPSGYYTVLIFNRTVDEFGTMSFDKMNTLGTAQCILYEKLFSWLGRSNEVGRTVYEPEEIVSGRTDHFYVRTMSERKVTSWDGERTKGAANVYTKGASSDSVHTSKGETVTYEVDSVMVRSRRMVYTANVSVHLKGIHNVKSVRSYLTGMAGGAFLSTRTATDTLATHVMESWSIERDAGDYTSGYITSSFRCLGLPEQYLSHPDSLNNRLNLSILLVDNKTVMDYSFNIGDIIEQIDDQFVLNLVLETDEVIPDVEPDGGSSAGFDVNIPDWGDETEVIVPL